MTPDGLPPLPARVPHRLRTTADLRALQRVMAHALYQPLTPDDDLAPRFRDGREMAEVAASFIKPNDRLSSFERLQIYARGYWYRVMDCVYEDAPGLRALLGEARFRALVRAYLAACPSLSYTLRNLCARLPWFIREQPRWTTPDTALAEAVARFEWAQTVAFDGEARPVLTVAEISRQPAARLRLGLQPYLTLLSFDWPVDDYVIAVKRRQALRAEASHVVNHGPRERSSRRVPRPRRRRVHLVVHRYKYTLYYKRVTAGAFRVLQRLEAGWTLGEAITAAGRGVRAAQVSAWFATWTELGWFCRRK
jgi:hypothetical protein